MILYRYMDVNSAIKSLEENTLLFSKLSSLNDPFEGTFSKNGFVYAFDEDAHFTITKIRENSYVTCLTRSHLNPLMWAHYGDNHKGVVVGFDIRELYPAIKNALIPIEHGSIIYTNTNPKPLMKRVDDPILPLSRFSLENLEYLRLVYLHKHSCWSYEEEVRCVISEFQSESHCLIPLSGNKDRFTVEISPSAIESIHLGARFNDNDEGLKKGLLDAVNQYKSESIFVSLCSINEESGSLMLQSKQAPPEYQPGHGGIFDELFPELAVHSIEGRPY